MKRDSLRQNTTGHALHMPSKATTRPFCEISAKSAQNSGPLTDFLKNAGKGAVTALEKSEFDDAQRHEVAATCATRSSRKENRGL